VWDCLLGATYNILQSPIIYSWESHPSRTELYMDHPTLCFFRASPPRGLNRGTKPNLATQTQFSFTTGGAKWGAKLRISVSGPISFPDLGQYSYSGSHITHLVLCDTPPHPLHNPRPKSPTTNIHQISANHIHNSILYTTLCQDRDAPLT
jgi:hypothetical protein